MSDIEHLDQLTDALGLRQTSSLYSEPCQIDHHSLCPGVSYSLRRLHPTLARQRRTERSPVYDQAFPCMCECHGPFEEHEE